MPRARRGGGGGMHRRHHGGGYRRPYYGGPNYYWNGLYWVSPQGLCYRKDEEGTYILVDCVAPTPAALFFDGTGNKVTPQGTGGTMDSSTILPSSMVNTVPRPADFREGGPLNKKNIRDFIIGVGVALVALYIVKKVIKK